MNDPRFANPPALGPVFATPLFAFSRTSSVAFVFNEGGRGLTVSVYRRPFALRIYLAGYVRVWGGA